MINVFYISEIIYSILGSIFLLFLIIFFLIIFSKINSVIKNINEASENVSDISKTVKEKIQMAGVISALRIIIEKFIKERKKDE
jgi:uncharacterized membrane protein